MPMPDRSNPKRTDAIVDTKTIAPVDVIETLKSRYAELSPQLQKAARFVIDNPGDIAVHSMRAIARRADVQHNAMVRLAREFGFEGYDQFRDLFRDFLTRDTDTDWLHRARSIHDRFPVGTDSQIVGEYVMQEGENLQRTFGETIGPLLKDAIERMRRAGNIYVLGVRSMFPIAYYFHYTCRMFDTRSVLLTGLGGAFADDLRSIRNPDVLIVFSYYPYAKDTITAVDFAKSRGASIIAITDSEVSPVLDPQGVNFIVSNASVSLFPSLTPALSVAQVLATLHLAEGGEPSMANLRKTQEQLDNFGVYYRK